MPEHYMSSGDNEHEQLRALLDRVATLEAERDRAREECGHVEWPEDERPRFTCDAPAGAKCRLECAESCWAEEWPCGPWDEEKDDLGPAHDMRDSGECHVVLFLDEDDHWEQDRYSGPIKVTWDGDHYDWEPDRG